MIITSRNFRNFLLCAFCLFGANWGKAQVVQLENVSDWGGANLTGLYLFGNPSNLTEATIGTDLTLQAVTTPNGSGVGGTPVPMTTVTGFYSGDGAALVTKDNLLRCTHNIPGETGGTSDAFKYTLILDIKIPTNPLPTYTAIFQTNTNNINDGECFVRSNGSIGRTTTTYSSANVISPNIWHRVIIVANLRDNSTDTDFSDNWYRIYVDGIQVVNKVGTSAFYNEYSLYGAGSATPYVLFFADNNGEDGNIHVSSLATLEGLMDPSTAATLGALPVDLLSFSCRSTAATIDLNWSVAFEQQLDYYQIERSENHTDWQILDKVAPRFEQGQKGTYTFTDQTPYPGINYYRLKMVDKDGAWQYSPITSATLAQHKGFAIFPSPVNDLLHIKNLSSGWLGETLNIYNHSGQIVRTITLPVDWQNFSISVSDLPSGAYFAELNGNMGENIVQFVKN